MTTPIEALLSLLARGITVRAVGRVLWVGPRPLPDDVAALCREHKAAWLTLLCQDAGDPWAPDFAGVAFTAAQWNTINQVRRALGQTPGPGAG